MTLSSHLILKRIGRSRSLSAFQSYGSFERFRFEYPSLRGVGGGESGRLILVSGSFGSGILKTAFCLTLSRVRLNGSFFEMSI